MKKIAIDIDNVLINLQTMKYVNRILGTTYKESDFTDWDMNNFSDEVKDVAHEAWRNVRFMCYECKTFPGVHQTLRRWLEQGHRLYAVTSRHQDLVLDTVAQLNSSFPNYFNDDVYFVNGSDKTSMFKKLGVQVVIEDWRVEDGLAAGAKTVLITNENTVYNHHKRDNIKLYQATSLAHVHFE